VSSDRNEVVRGLEPALLWQRFVEFTAIPRGSGNEEAAADYVIRRAKAIGGTHARDRAGNVVVRVPASPGRESAAAVCLQGHLDMVCEKRPEVKHDFLRDPIALVRDGDWIAARGTTLGADNGIAVAAILAAIEDPAVAHGPLEALFTVDEENGLTGASGLDSGLLTSRTLLNLDSEEEYALFVGCSGGIDSTGVLRFKREAAPKARAAVEVVVGGLKGGHSGLEIDRGRGNAIRYVARAAAEVAALGGRLVRVDGGNKRNAIPRDATAVLLVQKDRAEAAVAATTALEAVARAELGAVDPGVTVTAKVVPARGARPLPRRVQERLLRLLLALPHGVLRMSPDIPGLVQTSTNLAVIATGRDRVTISTSQRSSVGSERDATAASVRAAFELAGAEIGSGAGYPGWKPNLDSPVLGRAAAVHRRLFGREPAIKAIHAGLECGIIGEKFPGMDMVSFGPVMEGVHSPDERVNIPSVGRFWGYLTALLDDLSQPAGA
jgi:dipeptidase D